MRIENETAAKLLNAYLDAQTVDDFFNILGIKATFLYDPVGFRVWDEHVRQWGLNYPGIYAIRCAGGDAGYWLYIGKSGTWRRNQSGDRLENGSIRNRLLANRDGHSFQHWVDQLSEDGPIEVFSISSRVHTFSPAFLEAMLLQKHLSSNKRLPLFNLEF